MKSCPHYEVAFQLLEPGVISRRIGRAQIQGNASEGPSERPARLPGFSARGRNGLPVRRIEVASPFPLSNINSGLQHLFILAALHSFFKNLGKFLVT